MRTALAITLLTLLSFGVTAEGDAETPRQSFQAFVDAILREDMPEAERDAAFERYFDFDAWVKDREVSEGASYTDAERAAMKEDWRELFHSREFRDSWRKRNVRVLEEPAPQGDKAELVIAMTGAGGADEKFRVLMTRAADATHWRWYSIPQVAEALPEPTIAERIAAIEQALKRIAEQRAQLEAEAQALARELERLRAEQAEADAGDSPYATPQSVVKAAWTAIEKGDLNALLDCHTTRRVAGADTEALKARLAKTRERLMAWQVLDSTIDEKDPARAVVRVQLKLQRTGDTDQRTISVRVLKAGENWKIDEAP